MADFVQLTSNNDAFREFPVRINNNLYSRYRHLPPTSKIRISTPYSIPLFNSAITILNSAHFCTQMPGTEAQPAASSAQEVKLEERPYMCDLCGATFRVKLCLTSHRMTHTDVRPWTCDVCQTSFKHKYSLLKHERIHTNEKPHLCPFCGKGFGLKGSLQRHIPIHTGEKKHKCDYCDATFIQKFHLKSHVRKHTGEKPYECKFCDEKFSNNTSLRNHMKYHTIEKPFKCRICAMDFISKVALYDHIRVHTNILDKPDIINPEALMETNSINDKDSNGFVSNVLYFV